MKFRNLLFVFALVALWVNNAHAYYLGSINLSAENTVHINQAFDINWTFGIYDSYYNDSHPAMDVPMSLFLSNDETWDSTDILIATDVNKITENTGYTNKAKYDIKIPYNASVATGQRYLVMVIDPNNKIGAEKHVKPYSDFVKIFLYATVPDVAVTNIFVKQVTDPKATSKLKVDARIMNSGSQSITSTTFKIDVANSRIGLSLPLFTHTQAVVDLSLSHCFDTIINTIDLEGAGVNKEDFFIKISLANTIPGDTISRNDTLVQHLSWSKLDTFDLTRQYINMSAATMEINSCNAYIYDDGGPDNSYSNNINSTLIIRPSIPGTKVRLTLKKGSNVYYDDYLKVFDSSGAVAYKIDGYSSSSDVFDYVSKATDGSLKLQFYTDKTDRQLGFHLVQTCIDYKERRDTIEGCTTAIYGSFTFRNSKDTVIKYGVDSTLFLHVIVHPKIAIKEVWLRGNGSVTLEDSIYTQSTDFTKVLESVHHCDSTFIYHILVIPLCYSRDYYKSITACVDTIINGETITTSQKKQVKYKSFFGCDSTVNYTITIVQKVKQFDLGNDTTITQGQSFNIGTTTTSREIYKWDTGENTSIITVSTPAKYILTSSNYCGSWSDTINVAVIPPCNASTNRVDTSVCDSAVIGGEIIKTSKSKTVVYTLPGGCDSTVTYIVEIARDLAVNTEDASIIRTGNERVNIGLESIPTAAYLWSTGEKTSKITVLHDGQYTVTVSNSCGEKIKKYYVIHGDPLGANISLNPAIYSHPNPTKSFVTISNVNGKVLVVRDLNGTVCFSSEELIDGEITIDVSGWNKGVYFIYTMTHDKETFEGTIVKNE